MKTLPSAAIECEILMLSNFPYRKRYKCYIFETSDFKLKYILEVCKLKQLLRNIKLDNIY